MQIERIYIEHFRNLSALNVLPHPRFNFIWGDNGSGKSSFIEALYFMGHGRSFRSNKLHHIVQNEREAFNVFVQCEREAHSIPLGVMRSRSGAGENKVNQKIVATSLEIAKNLPMLALSPESLLLRGAKERARLFDWGVFHFDPSFELHWRECRKVIRQRNALLKKRAPHVQIQVWDQMLTQVAHLLSSMRQAFLEKFMPYFKASVELLLPEFDVHIHYHQGWSSQNDIELILKQCHEQDMALGYTQHGPHRVDYRFKLGHKYAADVLSRGQYKLLICSIKLAMAEYYKSICGTPALFLLDDLASEVDPVNREKILQAIINLGSQVFITSISQDFLVECMANQDYAQFHLEQGQLVD